MSTTMQREKSTRRLSPNVSVALSRMPSSNCQRLSEAFSISSNRYQRELYPRSVHAVEILRVSIGEVSRWPRYPGGEPINFAISCEC